MTDQPLLQTPGEVLAGARKSHGDSLEVVAARTKIPPGMLAAIEADEYHKVSGHLYVRSFLRTYAADVGLDPDRILDLYAKMSGERAPAAGNSESPVWEDEKVVVQKIGIPWKPLLGIAAVCILVGLGLFIMLKGDGDVPAVGEGPRTGGPFAADSSAVVVSEGIEEPAGVLDDSLQAAVAPPEDAAAGATTAGGAGTRALPPPALPGTPDLDLQGTGAPSLVLRVLCPEKIEVEVRRDSEPGFAAAVWPQAGIRRRCLPGTSVRARSTVAGKASWSIGARGTISACVWAGPWESRSISTETPTRWKVWGSARRSCSIAIRPAASPPRTQQAYRGG